MRSVTAMCAASPNAACCVASWPSQKWYTQSLGRGKGGLARPSVRETGDGACHNDDVFQEQGTYKYRMTTCMDVGGS